MQASRSVSIRLSGTCALLRFHHIGASQAFDEFLISFRQAVPSARFNRRTGWQEVSFYDLGRLVMFCGVNFAPADIHLELITEDQPSQLVLEWGK